MKFTLGDITFTLFKKKDKVQQAIKKMVPDEKGVYTVFHMGGGWGDAINISDWDKRRVVGWKTPQPKKGDYLMADMKEGRKGLFRFIKVEPCNDPRDMFFATIQDVGYTDEQPAMMILDRNDVRDEKLPYPSNKNNKVPLTQRPSGGQFIFL